MVEIEEITPDANAAKPSPQDDSTDERTRAFLRSLNLGDEERVGQLADAVEELKRLSSQMGKSQPAAVAAPDKVSCVREGWWYESAEASTAEAFALSRLQAVAKGSGDNAAREGIDDEGDVDEAPPRRDVREVGDPSVDSGARR